jgi:hypothetical protein
LLLTLLQSLVLVIYNHYTLRSLPQFQISVIPACPVILSDSPEARIIPEGFPTRFACGNDTKK